MIALTGARSLSRVRTIFVRIFFSIAMLTFATALAHAQILGVPASTTIDALTGANASSGSSHVSKLPISSVLPATAQPRLYAHLYGWFGDATHTAAGYNSADPAQIQKQVSDMVSRGIGGVIVNWHGSPDFTDQTARTLRIEAEKFFSTFQFAIEVDAAALADCTAAVRCDPTARLLSDLKYLLATYTDSPAYMKFQGRPVIFLFGMDAYHLDLTVLQNSLPGAPVLISRAASPAVASMTASSRSTSDEVVRHA